MYSYIKLKSTHIIKFYSAIHSIRFYNGSKFGYVWPRVRSRVKYPGDQIIMIEGICKWHKPYSRSVIVNTLYHISIRLILRNRKIRVRQIFLLQCSFYSRAVGIINLRDKFSFAKSLPKRDTATHLVTINSPQTCCTNITNIASVATMEVMQITTVRYPWIKIGK